MKYLGVKGHDVCDLPKLFRKCMCVFGERDRDRKREDKAIWQNVIW